MEVLRNRVDRLEKDLGEIKSDLREAGNRVSSNEKWINLREGELEINDDRLTMMEEQLAAHQTYIDERKNILSDLRELEKIVAQHGLILSGYPELQRAVKGIATYVTTQKGEKQGVWNLIKDVALLLGVIASALKLFHII